MSTTDLITRSVGYLSCIVGLLCYALSLSFKSLFGEWNPTVIVLYAIISGAISNVVLFAEKCPVSGVYIAMLRAHVEFFVLMLTSLYSFFADRSMNGKPDTLSVVSSVAFALTSLCISVQIDLGFQVGLFNFFLGCLTVQLMKIHLLFILVAAGFSYPLIVFRSYLKSQSEIRESSDQGYTAIPINDENSETPAQNNDTSEERSLSTGAHRWNWLRSFFGSGAQVHSLRRLCGKAQNVWVRISEIVKAYGNGKEEGYGSMHETVAPYVTQEQLSNRERELIEELLNVRRVEHIRAYLANQGLVWGAILPP